MSAGKLQRSPSGKLRRTPAGKVTRNTASSTECRCGCASVCFAQFGNLTVFRPMGAGYGASWGNVASCHRLFVWERRTVTSNVVGGAGAADWILKTTKQASGGPLGPYETSPGSAVLLDDEPYWWPECEVGGYEILASMWYEPTLAQVEAVRVGTGLLLPDGTYTLLATVRYTHLKELGVSPQPDLVPVTDGRVRLQSLAIVQHS